MENILVGIFILIILFSVYVFVFAVGYCKTSTDKEMEDEAQLRFLKEYNEKKKTR